MDLKESRTLRKLFKYVDEHEYDFIEVLSEAVSIPSVSLDPLLRESCIDMVNWISCKMKSLGIEIEECNIGRQTFSDGQGLRFPPIILGTLGNNPDLPTVCIYGHLDVYPAKHEDGWATNPFTVTEIEGKLYGRGTCDNKGSLLCWLNAVKAYQGAFLTLPVNLRFVFECMKESASEGLLPLLRERKGSFFKHISSVCISDNYWLGRNKPCLTYGTRGRCSFRVDVHSGNKDLDSGSNGGIMNEPMADLIYLLDTLIDRKGKILISNIYRDVTPVSEEELIRYKAIDFKVTEYKKILGVQELLHDEEKLNILMHRWRFPSLTIHRIESGFNSSSSTIIPYKVTGTFSIYLVPEQNPEKIKKQVVNHLSDAWMKRGSLNKFNVVMTEGMKAWAVDPTSKNFEAAKRAVKRVYNISPDLTREGSTKPLVLMFQEVSNNVILIPIGASDDGAHSPNEKINTANYMKGIKVCGAYLYEISQAYAPGFNGFTEFDFINIQSDL